VECELPFSSVFGYPISVMNNILEGWRGSCFGKVRWVFRIPLKCICRTKKDFPI
jgi:hypothetical protein